MKNFRLLPSNHRPPFMLSPNYSVMGQYLPTDSASRFLSVDRRTPRSDRPLPFPSAVGTVGTSSNVTGIATFNQNLPSLRPITDAYDQTHVARTANA